MFHNTINAITQYCKSGINQVLSPINLKMYRDHKSRLANIPPDHNPIP